MLMGVAAKHILATYKRPAAPPKKINISSSVHYIQNISKALLFCLTALFTGKLKKRFLPFLCYNGKYSKYKDVGIFRWALFQVAKIHYYAAPLPQQYIA